jgi:hypothetical protein
MKALSIRAPWWWFILHGGKDIENRDWPTSFRGRVLIHASKWWSKSSVIEDYHDALDMFERVPHPRNHGEITWAQMRALGGHIVGSVEIVGCANRSDSPWFQGKYGFVLAKPITLAKPIPFKGALGFFNVPDEIENA